MKLRTARKIRKRWRDHFEANQRIHQFRQETGPSGQALREVLGKLPALGGTPIKSRYETGWWPKGKLLHHLGIKGPPRYTRGQVQSAFNRLPRQEQVEWVADCRVIEAMQQIEHEWENPPSWGEIAVRHKRTQAAIFRLFAPPEDEPTEEVA